MKKILNLAFLASTLLWTNTSVAMKGSLVGPLRFLGQEWGKGLRGVPVKYKGEHQLIKNSGTQFPIKSGIFVKETEHKANSVVAKPSEDESEYFENRPEDQAAS